MLFVIDLKKAFDLSVVIVLSGQDPELSSVYIRLFNRLTISGVHLKIFCKDLNLAFPSLDLSFRTLCLS